MISHFFIDRPIFASVLSIIIALTGVIALLSLPLAEYPEITPPSVQVAITYPGASALVVADTVAAPTEQQVNGVPGMLYMSSQSGNDGSYTLTVTFDLGTDLNTALVMVQNRVTLAMPQLPVEVQLQGITIRKKTPDILNVISLYSPDRRYDDLYLSNYATIYLKDELLRVDGVSDINYLGERDYSIRIWLDPQKMAALSISALDVAAAVSSQNVEAAPGQIGPAPGDLTQSRELPLDTLGRLRTPEQFADAIVKVGSLQYARSSSALSSQGVGSGSSSVGSGNTSGAQLSTSMSNVIGDAALSTTGTSGGSSSSSGSRNSTSGSSSGSSSGTSSGSSGTSGSSSTGSSGSTSGSGTSSTTSGSGTSSTSTSAGGGTTGGGATGSGGGTTGGGANISSGATLPGPLSGSLPGSPASLVQGDSSTVGLSSISGPNSGGRPPSPTPGLVRIRDIARVEMGAQNYNQSSLFDGNPSVALAIHQLPGTNALQVADVVRKKMRELSSRFPEGVAYAIAYDTTPYIKESVMDVVHTLFEAVLLVALVVLVFLQNWRAAVIPLIAVPVAILGTFIVMAAAGFSLNNISLFGLVLAIGIVVDDAIVVVENVERWVEHGLEPREATRKAMNEVTGPVVAVAVVLCAVFVPCAFLGGITGQFFRQFAVTIAVSTVFSAFNSLTLSPALSAILIKKKGEKRDPLTWTLDILLGWFFKLFNWVFNTGTAVYSWLVGLLLTGSIVVLLVYGGLLGLTYFAFQRAPMGFIPDQDQGRVIVSVQLPDSASLERTNSTLALAAKIAQDTPGVDHTITISGMSFVLSANSPNFGSMFVVLKPFDQRREPGLSANAIMAKLRREFAERVDDGQVDVFNAPPIPGLSVAGGFKIMVEDRGGLGVYSLEKETTALVEKTRAIKGLVGVSTQFRASTPQLFLDIDRTKVQSLGVSLGDVTQTMQIFLGSLYVNSFNEFGRYWQVTLQAEGRFRTRQEDIGLLEVRNSQGRMVPLSTLATLRPVNGPVMVQRYNLYTAAPITGGIRPDISSGQAIDSVQAAAATLPRSISTEWTELMLVQIRAGNTSFYVFGLAVIFVFLALAALYESWSLPLAVILVVPLCLLCSLAGVFLTHLSVDIFVQIGLVVLVGLACKNAILIVEFAEQLHKDGKPTFEATVEASRLRLRPILMTSFAFILGVVPLCVATGAGAEMRRSLGTAVFSGMLGVTMFGVFLTPVFFYVIGRLGESPVFRGPLARWAGSALLGGGLGAAVGFLLAQLEIGRRPVDVIIGAVAGAALATLLPAVRRWRASGGGTVA